MPLVTLCLCIMPWWWVATLCIITLLCPCRCPCPYLVLYYLVWCVCNLVHDCSLPTLYRPCMPSLALPIALYLFIICYLWPIVTFIYCVCVFWPCIIVYLLCCIVLLLLHVLLLCPSWLGQLFSSCCCVGYCVLDYLFLLFIVCIVYYCIIIVLTLPIPVLLLLFYYCIYCVLFYLDYCIIYTLFIVCGLYLTVHYSFYLLFIILLLLYYYIMYTFALVYYLVPCALGDALWPCSLVALPWIALYYYHVLWPCRLLAFLALCRWVMVMGVCALALVSVPCWCLALPCGGCCVMMCCLMPANDALMPCLNLNLVIMTLWQAMTGGGGGGGVPGDAQP